MNVRGHIDEVSFVDPLARKLALGATAGVPERSSVYLRGWAFVCDPPRTADAIVVTLDGGESFELACNQLRPDVANAFGLPEMLALGFHGVGSLSNLTRGPHVLRVVLIDRTTGASAPLEHGKAFDLVDGALAFPATQRVRRDVLSIEVDAIAPTDDRRGMAVRGWAVDRRHATPASDVYACLDGALLVRGVIGSVRTDIAERLGMATVARCGYVVRFETRTLEPGPHVVELRAVGADGERYAVSAEHWFVVA